MFSFWRTQKAQSTDISGSAEILAFKGRRVMVRRQPYRRSVSISLQLNGQIRVMAPKQMPRESIEMYLRQNDQWIETNFKRYQALRERHPPKRYVEGEVFPLLGRDVRLRFMVGDSERVRMRHTETELLVAIPKQIWASFSTKAEHPELASVVASYYQIVGRRLLSERLRHYSERMGLYPTALKFGSQKTRWGSCSSQGRISLNWRLAFAPLDVIDYVVIHELAHLKFYNHSAQFWGLVKTQSLNCQQWRRWLRDHQFDADFLAKRSELHSE